MQCLCDIALIRHVEYCEWQIIVLGQCESRRVHHLELHGDRSREAEVDEQLGFRVSPGVAVVDAGNTILGDQNLRGIDLKGPLDASRVRREERRSESRRKDYYTAFFQVANCPAGNIGLGNLPHRDGRLHSRFSSSLIQEVLQSDGIDDGPEHPHVVGSWPIHTLLCEFSAAELVAPTTYDRDLNLVYLDRLCDLSRYFTQSGDVQTVAFEFVVAKSLSTELQQHPPLGLMLCLCIGHDDPLDIDELGLTPSCYISFTYK
jgi:hypothetical protein